LALQHFAKLAVAPARQHQEFDDMPYRTLFVSLLASSAIGLAVAGPAQAGKGDRADEAIAAAEAKIHTADTIGAGVDAPSATADAKAALAVAKENRIRGEKTMAINAAIRASALADTAIGQAQQRKNDQMAADQAAERDRAAAERERADAAQDQAAVAQQQAADANNRAAVAEQAAASSAADAAAARNAATLAAQTQPAQVETTVTTQGGAARSTHTKVVKKAVPARAPAPVTTTTTRVTTTP
jgi:hypothetical protein